MTLSSSTTKIFLGIIPLSQMLPYFFQQFLVIKRLDNIILDSLDFKYLIKSRFRRQDNDRTRLQIRFFFFPCFQPRHAVTGRDDPITIGLQTYFKHLDELRFVVNHEYLLGHRLSLTL